MSDQKMNANIFKIVLLVIFFVISNKAIIDAVTPKCRSDIIVNNGNVKGRVTIQDFDGYMRIKGWLSGLEPGEHPLHIHLFPDNTSDCLAAGEIYNPLNEALACPGSSYLYGDLNNVAVGESGNVCFVKYKIGQILHPFNISGKTFMVHGKLKMETPIRDPQRTNVTWPIDFPPARIACTIINVKCD